MKTSVFGALMSGAMIMAGPLVAETKLKVGLIDPPAHIDVRATEQMAEQVLETTGGEVVLEVYPAAQLGFANDMLSGMKLGTIEMFVGATTWLGTFDKDFWISGTPYVFNDQDQARAVHQGAYFQEMSDRLPTSTASGFWPRAGIAVRATSSPPRRWKPSRIWTG